MTELTEISGVGPARAEKLEEVGLESVEDVAEAELETIDEAVSASADPEEIRESAQVVNSVDHDESKADDPREDTRVLDVENREVAYYLVKGLIDENLRLKKRNEYDEAEQVNEVIDSLLDNVDPDGGTVEVDLDDLSVLYTSVRNIEQEFQGTRGLTDLAGQMRQARVQIQDLRSELWPDS